MYQGPLDLRQETQIIETSRSAKYSEDVGVLDGLKWSVIVKHGSDT